MYFKKYLIERTCPKSGFVESIVYTGSLLNKPKGWIVIRVVNKLCYIL